MIVLVCFIYFCSFSLVAQAKVATCRKEGAGERIAVLAAVPAGAVVVAEETITVAAALPWEQ